MQSVKTTTSSPNSTNAVLAAVNFQAMDLKKELTKLTQDSIYRYDRGN
jgi:hypothetical protein